VTYIKQFTVTAPARVDDSQPFVTLNIREAATAAGTYTVIDTQAWTDTTPSTVTAVAVETTLATLETGWYQFQWVDGDGAVTQWWGPVSSAASATDLCTYEDVHARMGAPDWSAGEEAQCRFLIDTVSAAIVAEVDKTEEWAATLSPVPGQLRALCVEVVARVMANPTGARSSSEQLGSYQFTDSFSDAGHGLELTPTEVLRARRAVWGTNTASARAVSVLDDIADVVSYPGSTYDDAA